MLLEIGLLKRKKGKNKNKTKQKPKKKKIQHCKVWAIPVPISTTKDVICCSNGYIYHSLDYITLLLFVDANYNNNNNSNNNCIYLWNCTVVLLHLELSSVDYDRLCCEISPCPLHPIAISFVCCLLNLHHSSWIS